MMLNDMTVPDELSAPAVESLERSRELAARWHGKGDGRLQYAFCPRGATSCSAELLRGAADMAEST